MYWTSQTPLIEATFHLDPVGVEELIQPLAFPLEVTAPNE